MFLGKDTPTARTLKLINIIGTKGPITLSELVERAQFPRTSVYRVCQLLKDEGWIYPRLTDNAYLLSAGLEESFAIANYCAPELEICRKFMCKIKAKGQYHATLSSVGSVGTVYDLDTTVRGGELSQKHSLVFSNVSIAAMTLLSEAAILRHLREFVGNATLEERRYVEEGRFFELVNRGKHEGHVWGADGSEVSVPLIMNAHTPCVITLSARSLSKRQIDQLRKELPCFKTDMQNLDLGRYHEQCA